MRRYQSTNKSLPLNEVRSGRANNNDFNKLIIQSKWNFGWDREISKPSHLALAQYTDSHRQPIYELLWPSISPSEGPNERNLFSNQPLMLQEFRQYGNIPTTSCSSKMAILSQIMVITNNGWAYFSSTRPMLVYYFLAIVAHPAICIDQSWNVSNSHALCVLISSQSPLFLEPSKKSTARCLDFNQWNWGFLPLWIQWIGANGKRSGRLAQKKTRSVDWKISWPTAKSINLMADPWVSIVLTGSYRRSSIQMANENSSEKRKAAFAACVWAHVDAVEESEHF